MALLLIMVGCGGESAPSSGCTTQTTQEDEKYSLSYKGLDFYSKNLAYDKYTLSQRTLPEGVTYPENNDFAKKLEASIKILSANPDTKVISLGNGGLGGWDDHSEARDYVTRMEALFNALNSAMEHIKAEGKEGEINICIFGDFGRNVNLNSAYGWDHGNTQNLFWLGGQNYFNPIGVIGETALENSGALNSRLYLKPKSGSVWFEPLSVAATIYSIYGIENPEVLTGGYGVIGAGILK